MDNFVELHRNALVITTQLLAHLDDTQRQFVEGAVAGGGYFVIKSWGLLLEPSRSSAMGAFSASLVQLSLVLVAATIDGLMR